MGKVSVVFCSVSSPVDSPSICHYSKLLASHIIERNRNALHSQNGVSGKREAGSVDNLLH